MPDPHATGSRAAYLIRHPLPGQKRVWKVIDRATDETVSTHAVYEDAIEAARDAQADYDAQTPWSESTASRAAGRCNHPDCPDGIYDTDIPCDVCDIGKPHATPDRAAKIEVIVDSTLRPGEIVVEVVEDEDDA